MWKNSLFYFGLEAVKNRYTEQLSNEWMPYSLEKNKLPGWNITKVTGQAKSPMDIKTGQVLDAGGRSVYAMEQCISFIAMIEKGWVKNGDVLYFQDFWQPGIEAIFYTLQMHNIETRNYAMLHAQTVDQYDFTYKMRDWMRPFELGIAKKMNGVFIGSEVHKEQLRAAGFECPMYIVSLPFGKTLELQKKNRNILMKNKKNQVVFTSRFDFEKNPMFMLTVAEQFLKTNENWEWLITTGSTDIRSNDQFILDRIKRLEETNSRFKVIRNITKENYYDTLAESKIQFSSSLQDYVSWTLIESTTFACDVVYPHFRSFPEILPELKMYQAFSLQSALDRLNKAAYNPRFNGENELEYISDLSELGLLMEGYIMFNDWKEHEINIWQQKEYCIEKFGFLKAS